MIELDNKKILVTFLMHLGDLTLTTPFIRVLRQAAPKSHIAMLVDEKLKDVVMFNPNLNQIFTIDKKGKDDTFFGLLKCAGNLSSQNFDIVINLHPNERCSFIAAFAKTKMRVGVSHFLFKWRWDNLLKLNRKLHAADMYVDVLKQLGVKSLNNEGLEIFPSNEHFALAEKFWQEQNIKDNDKLIGFNIGSAVITKRWAVDRFARCADILASSGYKIVYFGGKMDVQMVKEVCSLMKTKAIVATGNFSIGTLAAAMRKCSLIITNDSGPMHVAISQKTPIVALYGPSNPKLYGPYANKNSFTVVKSNPECFGCEKGMKHHCSDMSCMKNLSVEQVVSAAEKMLQKNKR